MATQIWVTENNGQLHFDLQSGQRLASRQELENNIPCEPGSLWERFGEGDIIELADGQFVVDYDRDEGLCPVLRQIA